MTFLRRYRAAVRARDRVASLALFALAVIAWAALGYVLFNYYPSESAPGLLAGALLLGAAIALSVTPVLWLTSFVFSRRIAYRGTWWRAGRRAALIGLIATMFVLMRGQGSFSVPLVLFVIAMAVLVEVTLSVRA